MTYTGNLQKMNTRVNSSGTVEYQLELGGTLINMNDILGREVELIYKDVINCVACGVVTRKSFAQGFCFSCMQTAPEASECVLRPVLCKAHMGIARDMEWARSHCLQPHYVYLANTGEVKVGVTRESQIPTRWIDQGASQAIKVCKTPNRHIAGLIEVLLSKTFPDKTLWKKMVSGDINPDVDLMALREEAWKLLPLELDQYRSPGEEVSHFRYPVKQYPIHPKTVNLEENKRIKGILTGIKGQYLLFENDQIINIRKYTGYLVDFIL